LIDNKKISKFAISIVDTLQKNNFEAYLVGGCVRDILCDMSPKDFDIATSATPEQVRKIFKASRIIGRRFKLVHVFSRDELIEVATFRSDAGSNQNQLIKDDQGKILRDNIWGSIEDDCIRRDFSLNALYYCPIKGEIKDFSNGQNHIRKKIIVSLGDPQKRFEEDPVRSLRAIRFSSKLGFKIDNKIKDAIYDKSYLLSDISNARLFDEFCKIFLNGNGEKNFNKLHSFHLLKYLIASNPDKNNYSKSVMIEAVKNTDARVKNNQSKTPGFLIAALLWPELLKECVSAEEINIRKFFRSMDKILKRQQIKTAIPRKFYNYIKDIWVLQLKLHSRIGNQPYKTLKHPRFRAAYDFMLVRERAAKVKKGPGDWWEKFQLNDQALRSKLINSLKEKNEEDSFKKFGFSEELR
jgi:poly(A) polymerase